MDLEPFGFPDLFEQVWLRKRDDALFELCCIPFRVYGLALRDTVRATPNGVLVSEIVRPSGNRALRVLLGQGRGRADVGQAGLRIEAVTRAAGLLYEWSGDRHIAVDVPPDANVDDLLRVIIDEEKGAGVKWEWADVEPFRR
ncbi:DUF4265 domain-containing protein [Micromonospora noduli]|uniref:DUF4265 domain-containing protein n=1 Tax=Micromonospora noduli TaxID=709876 RepID=UPI0015EB2A3E|nr:DUF4265 domain-containing protein [Micromonospora noduli]